MKKMIKAKTATKGRTTRAGGLAAKVQAVSKSNQRTDLPDFRAGDTLRVHVRIKEGDKERVQAYEGDCIKIGNKGNARSFTVRKTSHGVGVERVFLMNSPKVAKVEVVTEGRVRRAKLYYLRRLEGKAARIDREVQSNESKAASAAATASKPE